MRSILRPYEPGEISSGKLYRGLSIQVVAGSLGVAWFGIATGMPITMFMDSLGASAAAVGLLVTCQQLAIAAQLPAAWLGERLESRKMVWGIAALVHRAIWFLPGLMPFLVTDRGLAVTLVVATAAASAILAQIATPLWLSWMADLIPGHISGRFWGIRQTATTAAFAAAMLFSGLYLTSHLSPGGDTAPPAAFAWVLGIAAAMGVADILIHLFVPEPRPNRSSRAWGNPLAALKTVAANRDFARLTVAMSLWYLGLALTGVFGQLYMKHHLGMDYREISIFIVAGVAGSFATSFPLGWLADKLGAVRMAVGTLALAPLFASYWFLLPDGGMLAEGGPLGFSLLFITLGFLAGGLFAAMPLLQMTLTAKLLPPHGRTMALGRTGLVSAWSARSGRWSVAP